MSQLAPLSAEVTDQGAPVVNSVMEVLRTPQVRVFEIDLHSKYCEVCATCGHQLLIGDSDRALKLHPTREGVTILKIDLDPDFEFVAFSDGRYTITAVAVSREALRPFDLMSPERVVWIDNKEKQDE